MTLEQKMADKYDDGLDKGIQGAVEILRKIGRSDQDIMKDISDQYHLSEEQAKKYL